MPRAISSQFHTLVQELASRACCLRPPVIWERLSAGFLTLRAFPSLHKHAFSLIPYLLTPRQHCKLLDERITSVFSMSIICNNAGISECQGRVSWTMTHSWWEEERARVSVCCGKTMTPSHKKLGWARLSKISVMYLFTQCRARLWEASGIFWQRCIKPSNGPALKNNVFVWPFNLFLFFSLLPGAVL